VPIATLSSIYSEETLLLFLHSIFIRTGLNVNSLKHVKTCLSAVSPLTRTEKTVERLDWTNLIFQLCDLLLSRKRNCFKVLNRYLFAAVSLNVACQTFCDADRQNATLWLHIYGVR
jgi:hypothetical protein